MPIPWDTGPVTNPDTSDVPNLTTKDIEYLLAHQHDTFTNILSQLSPAQIAGLSTSDVKKLSAQDLQNVTFDSKLTQQQIGSLSPDQLTQVPVQWLDQWVQNGWLPDTTPNTNYAPYLPDSSNPDFWQDTGTDIKNLNPSGAATNPQSVPVESNMSYSDLYHAFLNASNNLAGTNAAQWTSMSQDIEEAFTTFQQRIEGLNSTGGWTGKTAQAAVANIKQSFNVPQAVVKGADAMSQLVNAFDKTIFNAKWNLEGPNGDRFEDYINTKQSYPHAADYIEYRYNLFAAQLMQNLYGPAITAIAAGNPDFSIPAPTLKNDGSGDNLPDGGDKPPNGGDGPPPNFNNPDFNPADDGSPPPMTLPPPNQNIDTSPPPGGGPPLPGGPGDPFGPGGPGDPFGPGNPDDPFGTGNPGDPFAPGGHGNPPPGETNIATPGDPGDPFGPGGPGDPFGPGNPDDPFAPGDPFGPGDPDDPFAPGDPFGPGAPGGPGNPPPGETNIATPGGPGTVPPVGGPPAPGAPGDPLSSALSPAEQALQQGLGAAGKGGAPGGPNAPLPKNLAATPPTKGLTDPVHAGGGGGAGIGSRSGMSELAGAPIAATARAPQLATSGLARGGPENALMRPAGAGEPGGGSGLPGGGQRGAEGKDKEHKPNKALRNKKNGELAMGEVKAVVPVIGDDGSEPEPPAGHRRPAPPSAPQAPGIATDQTHRKVTVEQGTQA